MKAFALAIASASLTLFVAGCQRSQGGSTAGAPQHAAPDIQAIAAVPLGDVAGGQKTPDAAQLPNPYEKNPQAVEEGHRLFVQMNCAGCHGYDASGGMGPNLTDNYWRYGGAPVQLFKSIYEGRPQGMPAWNPALPPDEIWKLVAYLQSLGGTVPAGEFQAGVQGDRAKMNFAPETPHTVPPGAKAPQAKGETAATSPAEARPDAGGHP